MAEPMRRSSGPGRLPSASLPRPGNFMVVYIPEGVPKVWAAIEVEREFFMRAEKSGPAVVDMLDRKVTTLREQMK